MGSSGGTILRFAVGTPEAPKSALWRIVANGNDAYVGANSTLMGLFKVSLHRNEWLVGFTRQSGTVIAEKGSRHVQRWRRPAEFASGWTMGPAIAAPHIPASLGTHALGEVPTKAVVWVRAAEPGEVALLQLFMVGPAVAADERRRSPVQGGVVIGAVTKRDRESVVVVAHYQAMDAPFRLTCESMLRKERATYRGPIFDPTAGGALFWVSTSGEVPFITDLPAPLDWIPT
jgi:hypothetical protein